MSTIDFAFGAENRIRKACEVAYKHFLAGRQMLVYCTDAKRMQAFSKGLWGIEKTAFVPHVDAKDPSAGSVLIRTTADNPANALLPGQEPPWLLNLDLACPPDYEQFPRVLEIVSEHEQDKQLARERWKHYSANPANKVKAHSISS
ncbi:DNA polymerase III subunit chi [Advenella sp. RU8]|uniref:DNA polymerase III subunit chi n=1 Tax=Advenella sp. RU8 TaxID=3399575 RepID=UPI003AAA8C8F